MRISVGQYCQNYSQNKLEKSGIPVNVLRSVSLVTVSQNEIRKTPLVTFIWTSENISNSSWFEASVSSSFPIGSSTDSNSILSSSRLLRVSLGDEFSRRNSLCSSFSCARLILLCSLALTFPFFWQETTFALVNCGRDRCAFEKSSAGCDVCNTRCSVLYIRATYI